MDASVKSAKFYNHIFRSPKHSWYYCNYILTKWKYLFCFGKHYDPRAYFICVYAEKSMFHVVDSQQVEHDVLYVSRSDILFPGEAL